MDQILVSAFQTFFSVKRASVGLKSGLWAVGAAIWAFIAFIKISQEN